MNLEDFAAFVPLMERFGAETKALLDELNIANESNDQLNLELNEWVDYVQTVERERNDAMNYARWLETRMNWNMPFHVTPGLLRTLYDNRLNEGTLEIIIDGEHWETTDNGLSWTPFIDLTTEEELSDED